MTIQLNLWPMIAFAGVLLCWIAFVASFLVWKKPPSGKDHERESKSILGIVLQGLSYALVWGIPRRYFMPMFNLNETFEIILAILTIALAVSSVWFVAASVRALGKQWSLTARLVEGHKLITEGPYRFVRNPIYTGMLGMLIATGLAVSHWIALPIAIIVFMIGTRIRVLSEEKLLREAFGQEFESYARRTPAVIPRPF